jgi:hypothetical protein
VTELVVALLFGLGGLLLGSLWIVGAVYIYIDADRRNVKGAWLWALGALLAGPLALVAYFIDRPKAAVKSELRVSVAREACRTLPLPGSGRWPRP